jgi:hypothetical protein
MISPLQVVFLANIKVLSRSKNKWEQEGEEEQSLGKNERKKVR